MGYAQESGLPYEMGLVKNQYSGRTFIQPTKKLREQGVNMKLSAVRGVVAGKRVVLVDDSIVRGTTSRRIVKLLKDAGAAEVHLRIASPELKYPCFYGIDIQHASELIAANQTLTEMCQTFSSDSLGFLSVPSLIQAVGLEAGAPNGSLCVAYFDGNYPTPLYDYQKQYDEEQNKLHHRDVINGVTMS
jgi:amidophosphoribosyltransferase